MSQVFKVFSSCLITVGAVRFLLVDVQRKIYHLLPISMYEIILKNDGSSIEDILNQFKNSSPEDIEVINEYFDFLFENEIIFLCNKEIAANFKPIPLNFNYPARISNSVLAFKNLQEPETIKIILKQLVQLNCYSVEVTILESLSDFTELTKLLELFKMFEIQDLTIFLNGNLSIDEELINVEYNFLNKIVFYNSEYENSSYKEYSNLMIINSKHDLSDNKHCGKVGLEFLIPGLTHISESYNHNTCLNRKISIDAQGNIKNCPSMQEHYGNINETTLEEAINKSGFKKYWNIKKDEITKCKDCEFRHICTDCRAYLDNPDDMYSAPLKCGFDPYTCEWEEWSTNPLKGKAIDHYGMKHIIL
ncbi:grasp-with-spasm system SPASM domain peptide maturase [Sphingobacterium faecium]|uniref:grasp-with-spasm system SPASM domain peptide maturase n=1 Tax=Sphingobacterium faecium TaxID=34087 RepID=UPI003208EC8F